MMKFYFNKIISYAFVITSNTEQTGRDKYLDVVKRNPYFKKKVCHLHSKSEITDFSVKVVVGTY